MKLQLLAIGTKMPAWVQTGIFDYQKRLGALIGFTVSELPAARRHKNPSAADIKTYKKSESAALLQHQKGKLWALDAQGVMLSSEQLATKLQSAMHDGQNISLVIGGADGLDESLLTRADFCWSLSALTLPHPLVRVLVIEQLYRAMSMLNHHPYHRGE